MLIVKFIESNNIFLLDQLVFWLSESSVQALFNDENPPNASTEQKVLEFLETRFEIFLKAFPTTIAEDRELLEQKFSSTKLMLVQYRILEKQTLEKVLETIGAKMNKVKTE